MENIKKKLIQDKVVHDAVELASSYIPGGNLLNYLLKINQSLVILYLKTEKFLIIWEIKELNNLYSNILIFNNYSIIIVLAHRISEDLRDLVMEYKDAIPRIVLKEYYIDLENQIIIDDSICKQI